MLLLSGNRKKEKKPRKLGKKLPHNYHILKRCFTFYLTVMTIGVARGAFSSVSMSKGSQKGLISSPVRFLTVLS